jgi:hypothetical protein
MITASREIVALWEIRKLPFCFGLLVLQMATFIQHPQKFFEKINDL